ncbi:hypothetical protein WMY93_032470 [Mugilogobius chulae]|uniref:Uncharacterized protein n=1 Tax=Mugilogobius chulae TaxID=88201 RepID=A0AAW0MNH7_9GOBI
MRLDLGVRGGPGLGLSLQGVPRQHSVIGELRQVLSASAAERGFVPESCSFPHLHSKNLLDPPPPDCHLSLTLVSTSDYTCSSSWGPDEAKHNIMEIVPERRSAAAHCS